MKKIILGLVLIVSIFMLCACGEKETPKPQENTPVSGEVSEVVKDSGEIVVETDVEDKKYGQLIDDYNSALEEFDLEDLDSEKKIEEKNSLISIALIEHIARYKENGVKINYVYYDIDKNGEDELLVCADNAIGSIYAYDSSSDKVVSIFNQSTLERGTLSIYDNGVLLSSGAGGAALHYYEFGKMGEDGISYVKLESIEEEYTEENEKPTYKDADSGETLNYTSIDEVMDKYVANSDVVEFE